MEDATNIETYLWRDQAQYPRLQASRPIVMCTSYYRSKKCNQRPKLLERAPATFFRPSRPSLHPESPVTKPSNRCEPLDRILTRCVISSNCDHLSLLRRLMSMRCETLVCDEDSGGEREEPGGTGLPEPETSGARLARLVPLSPPICPRAIGLAHAGVQCD